jgi:hypothetical protein
MKKEYWFVEKVTGINRYVLISGYNEDRKVWKDSRGMSDFACEVEAKMKADDLNGVSQDE